MTIVRCEKSDCIYNEDGVCTSDIVWITETGECMEADDEEAIRQEFLEDDDEDE